MVRLPIILWISLILLLLAIALSLVGLVVGFDLGDVDLWIDDHIDLFHGIGDLLWRIGCGFVLLCCVGGAWVSTLGRDKAKGERIGWGCLVAAIPIAWFAWIGMTMTN